ncbi:MAG TPA: diguanylate cyclase, partial [Polyangiaceae bacterium]
PEEAFDRLTRIAAKLLNCPIALVSIVDDTRQFFKSGTGLSGELAEKRGTPLSHAFCQHVVIGGEFIVDDARHDDRIKENLAIKDYGVESYLGIPLVSPDDRRLGSFCAIDTKPRHWTDEQIMVMRDLAAAANSEIKLRAAANEAALREQTLDTLFTAANIGILVRDRLGIITRTNPRLAEILGYDQQELFGVDPRKLMHPDDAAVEEAFRQELFSGKRERAMRTTRFVQKNGETIVVKRTTAALRGENGVFEGTVSFIEDMSETLRLQREVQRREELHRTIVQNIPNAAVFLFDAELRFIAAEGERIRTGAIDANKILGKTADELIAGDADMRAKVLGQYRETLKGAVGAGEYAMGDRVLELHSLPVRDESDIIIAGMLFSYDVTERHRQSAELDFARNQLSALIDHMSAGVVFENKDRVVQIANRSFCALFGLTPGEVVGHELRRTSLLKTKMIDQDGYRTLIQKRLADRQPIEGDRLELIDGRVIERNYAPFDASGDGGSIWIYRDVTDRERDRAKLAQQAADLEKLSTRDELTGLYNRRGFMMLAEQELKSAFRAKRKLVVFFADMNGMKEINDKLGHKMGDRALVDTAIVLRRTFREADLIARLGGDEYVVLAVDATPDNIAAISSRLRHNMEELNMQSGRPFRISVSVGASVYDPENDKSVEALLAEADQLMYEQKKARKPSGFHVAVKLPR